MTYEQFSRKQLTTLTWWNNNKLKQHDAIICDGSIRSGKTISMAVGFILWSMTRFNGQAFAICGKTVESLRRNVILLLPRWLEGLFTITERRSENLLVVSVGGVSNRYFLFGGRDESSYALIQGMTLAGVLFDEVALMPRSFVEQALARCSVDGSRFWFNCNPDHPNHWFYQEWILDKENKKNRLYLHFTMNDNCSLSKAVKQRYESMYTGVFYDRYICGLWRVAEGLVYQLFDKKRHVVQTRPSYGEYYISVDYGTLNPFSAGLWCVEGGQATRIAEYYYDGRQKQTQKTDEEYYTELEKLAGDREIQSIVIDPSAASFIACIRKHGKFLVRKARNDVLDGIRVTATFLHTGRLFIHKSCEDCIREFSLYRWDEKKTEDVVLKENDHAMDDVRYFCYTILKKEFRWEE